MLLLGRLKLRLARPQGPALDLRRLRPARPVLLRQQDHPRERARQALGLSRPCQTYRSAPSPLLLVACDPAVGVLLGHRDGADERQPLPAAPPRARGQHRGRALAEQLLERPDRLIGMILVCNNFVNSAAAAIVTLIALSLGGEAYAAIGVGAVHRRADHLRRGRAEDLRRAVSGADCAARRGDLHGPAEDPVSGRLGHQPRRQRRAAPARRARASRSTARRSAARNCAPSSPRPSTVIPHRHQRMLMSILDLEKITVDDIMVPRQEIDGIDLTDDWDDIARAAARLPPHAHAGVRRQPRQHWSASCT